MPSLDKKRRSKKTTYNPKHGEATVFICGDGEYWWSRKDNGKQKYSPLYIVINMKHAVAMAKCSLELLADKESIF